MIIFGGWIWNCVFDMWRMNWRNIVVMRRKRVRRMIKLMRIVKGCLILWSTLWINLMMII